MRRNPLGRRPAIVILTLSLGATLASCSPTYVLRAAWEEGRILWRREPIPELLNDRNLDPGRRAKLELVVEARTFASRDLGLKVGKSYTSFADIGRDTLALILSASLPDRLQPYTWWFPIVGSVPYKGFFSRQAAEAERSKLQAKGYDTYLRPTAAFSTLGWFPDPLLSTVLASQDSVGLVETVIHEVTHNTLFVPDHVTFNESFANFVGSVGAIDFFCRPGHAADDCETARARWHDSVEFGTFLDSLWNALDTLYAQNLPRPQVLDRRGTLLKQMAERYRTEYVPEMQTPGYARFDPDRLNNASLLASHLYYHRLDLFQGLYERDGDLARVVRRVSDAVKGADDPWKAVESLADTEAPADSTARTGEGTP